MEIINDEVLRITGWAEIVEQKIWPRSNKQIARFMGIVL